MAIVTFRGQISNLMKFVLYTFQCLGLSFLIFLLVFKQLCVLYTYYVRFNYISQCFHNKMNIYQPMLMNFQNIMSNISCENQLIISNLIINIGKILYCRFQKLLFSNKYPKYRPSKCIISHMLE